MEDYPPQQSVPVTATARPRTAQLSDAKSGSMSVNVFSMGMCPASCVEPPTVPVPCSPSKRRRRRKRRSRAGAFVRIEERIAKLEQELKQVRFQVACQERRIAELETKAMRTKGKDRAAKMPAQSLPSSGNEVNLVRQIATRRKETGPASRNDGPEPSAPDQGSQARAPRPVRAGRRLRPRRRRRKSRNTQDVALPVLIRAACPMGQTGNESRRSVPGPEWGMVPVYLRQLMSRG